MTPEEELEAQATPLAAENIDTEADKLKQELNEWKDKYFRALAETENTRKRLQKEKIESQSFAIQDVVLDFLQPLDHLEQALNASQNASDEVKHWAIGFRMILQQLKQVGRMCKRFRCPALAGTTCCSTVETCLGTPALAYGNVWRGWCRTHALRLTCAKIQAKRPTISWPGYCGYTPSLWCRAGSTACALRLPK